ncbi:SulP family inorganic anion transporter [Geitlerinema sp. P-1104]|uniref:SulP family inorganic anion transporter n=1 Tax=Geitlerinema sp. P-1104 TaxID=2546230 RepID=UPI001476E88F|nr:SulP family inorganic anion transporter [Geitlerinema sp. P-1104]NMG56979.1 SulP family inorganic anion transporter [Geitlerinema sp. P-1104]
MNITNYIHTRNLRGDLFGGVTAAIVGLPMALAFGVASGAGAIAGIYSAVLLGFFAALFGGTPTLISNPTGPMTVVFTAVIATFTAKYPGPEGWAIAFTIVMMAGAFQILFGVLRLGKYVTLMPYTVISGFMSGIGVIMVILQLPPLLGQEGVGGVLNTVMALPELAGNLSLPELALGGLTLAVLFLTPGRISRVCPPQLLALLLGTGISATLLSNQLRIVGEIPTGLPELYLPTISLPDLQLMMIDAVMLGMLGCIDSLLTSVISDSITQYEHNSDKELIGQGVGNIISGLCGGLPGAGATMGTVVNIQAGGRTALSGMIHALTLLMFVFVAAGFTEIVPLSVLAAIALKVGLDIVDWSFLKRAHHLSLKAAAIMYGVLLLTVFVDLIVAVGVGIFIANVLTIQRLSDIQAENIKAITDPEAAELLEHEEQLLLDQVKGQVLLLHLGTSLSFGAAKAISQRHALIGQYQVLILDFRDVPMLGVTASLAMEKMVKDALKRGLDVYVVGSSGKVERRLEKFDILSQVPRDHQTSTLREALTQIVETLGETQLVSVA